MPSSGLFFKEGPDDGLCQVEARCLNKFVRNSLIYDVHCEICTLLLLLLLLLLFVITFIRVFTIIHLIQNISSEYIELQLFCSYNSWHM